MTDLDGIDGPFNRAMDKAIAHDQRQPIPVLPAETTTLIELLTTNARMPYPVHMPLYADVRPDAVCAVRAVGELPGMRIEEKRGAVELWNAKGLLVAIVFGVGK